MSCQGPLGTDGAFMHRGRLSVHEVLRIIAESVYVRVEAYLRGDIVSCWALGPGR